MERRDFFKKSVCGLAYAAAVPAAVAFAQENEQPARRPKYKIDIEIFEAREDTWCHKKGEKFQYPDEMDKICPWLLSSMHDFILLLQNGVELSWKYEGTPYEKVIDPDGVTTEYIRCPDPTADLVAKIIRTRVS